MFFSLKFTLNGSANIQNKKNYAKISKSRCFKSKKKKDS